MSAKQFNDHERWAIFETHGAHDGTRCWLCGEPLAFREMVVDHILPEHLLKPEYGTELAVALTSFGLADTFELNSYGNWLPAHGHCNTKKGEHVFRATPIIQIWIDQAIDRAERATAAAKSTASDLKKTRAIATLSLGEYAVPREELDRLVQSYATANTNAVVTGTKLNVPDDPNTIGFAYYVPVYGHVPPTSVYLAPGLGVRFEQTPKPRSDGPFVYTITTDPNVDTPSEAVDLEG